MPPLTIQLSGFADESSQSKNAEQQLAVMAALGLRRYTLRFIDMGAGIKNAMDLAPGDVANLVMFNNDYGLEVATLGSPIGKVKLLDVEDGTKNKFKPFDKYLTEDVDKACQLAASLGTRLVRGFSFYHPKGEEPKEYLPQVIDQLGQIAEKCSKHELLFGLEVEANLVGQTAELLSEIHRQVNLPALVLIFDAANILTQGFSPEETFAQYEEMKPGLGWIHIKDYRPLQSDTRGGHIDEEALCEYRPVTAGSGVYEKVLRDLAANGATHQTHLNQLGLPGMLLDLEPHVRGGGQFGGFSGPDGMGVALRSLCDLMEQVGLENDLKTPRDLS